jgi:hypothetical protein
MCHEYLVPCNESFVSMPAIAASVISASPEELSNMHLPPGALCGRLMTGLLARLPNATRG